MLLLLILLLGEKSNPEAIFVIAQDLFTILDSFNLLEGMINPYQKRRGANAKSSVMINFKLKLCLR